MKLAFGTYGMPGITPEDALPRLAKIGYKGLEISVGPRYCVEADKMDAARKERIKALCRELHMEIPSLMMMLNVMGTEAGLHERNLLDFRKVARLAAEITVGRTPVVTSTMGGKAGSWEEFRKELVRRLKDYAAVAEETGIIFAIEPHVGGGLDLPEKAVWVMESIKHPAIRVNFDISHFAIVGMTIEQCVPLLVPLAVHTHVKDGRMENGKVKFLLPGEGDFDYVGYFQAMDEAGWDDFITVEVSGMVSSRPDYDPYKAAEFCFGVLDNALKQAGLHGKS